jgi:hypothetical protein
MQVLLNLRKALMMKSFGRSSLAPRTLSYTHLEASPQQDTCAILIKKQLSLKRKASSHSVHSQGRVNDNLSSGLSTIL